MKHFRYRKITFGLIRDRETFGRIGLILHPKSFLSSSTSASWLKPNECLWRGPENLVEKIPLATIASYRNNAKLRKLFNDILDIRNANWTDYRDALQQLKGRETFPPDVQKKIVELYELLRSCKMSDEDVLCLL